MRAHITDIDFDAVAAYEKRFRHDVMAHIHAFGDVAPAAKGFIHYGATSAFVTDNADLMLDAPRHGAPARESAERPSRAVIVRARVARRADARIHAPPAGAADDRRQARHAVDAGSRARPGRSRSPDRHPALPRRERNDRHAGELPRDLRRRSREGARARRARHAEDRVCVVDPGVRADLFAQDRRAGARRRRRDCLERHEVQRRPARAAIGRRDRGAVRERADRLVGDGVQAEPDALGAHRVARALRGDARAQREPHPRRPVLRAHARRQRQPPPGDSREFSGDRCDPHSHGERGKRTRSASGTHSAAAGRGAAVHGDRGADRARGACRRRSPGRARAHSAAQHRGGARAQERRGEERHARTSVGRRAIRRARRRSRVGARSCSGSLDGRRNRSTSSSIGSWPRCSPGHTVEAIDEVRV